MLDSVPKYSHVKSDLVCVSPGPGNLLSNKTKETRILSMVYGDFYNEKVQSDLEIKEHCLPQGIHF